MKKFLTTQNFRLYPTKEQKILLDKEFTFYKHYIRALRDAINKAKTERLIPLVESDVITICNKVKEKILGLKFDFSKFYYRSHIKFANENIMNAIKYPRKSGLKRYILDKTTIKLDDPSCYVMLGNLYFKNVIKIKLRPKIDTIDNVAFYTLTRNRGRYILTAVKFVDGVRVPRTGKGCGIDIGFRNGLVIYDTDGSVEEYKFENARVNKLFNKAEFYKKVILNLEKSNPKYAISNNYKKVTNKLANVYERIQNIRNYEFNIISEKLVLKYDLISVESVDIEDIYKGNVKRYEISKASFGRFFDYLKNKCQKYNKYFIKVDRYFPSSQICSECGVLHKEMKDYREQKQMICECGYQEDRDINAAKNILRFGLEQLRKRNDSNKVKNSKIQKQ